MNVNDIDLDRTYRPAASPSGTADTATSYCVFLVEDSPVIRNALVDSLESSGRLQVVGHADSVAGAWSAMRGQPIDAVIIDLHLRKGNGLELLTLLKSEPQAARMKKIVLTNYPADSFRQQCREMGAPFFFDKSLEFDRVVDTLESAAAKKARDANH